MSVMQDWVSNKGNGKSLIILTMFRLAHMAGKLNKPYIYIFYPYLLFYRVTVEWILGVEIPWLLTIGPRTRLFHGQSLVINGRAVIGSGCTLRHCTTIGSAYNRGRAPVIGDNVDIGCNSIILGEITIGSNSVIAAGSVVVHDVPEWVIVAGNPAKVIRSIDAP